jgi:hypothetical protein
MGIIKGFSRISPKKIKNLRNVTDLEFVDATIKEVSENIDIDKSWEVLHYIITGQKAFHSDHEFAMILSPNRSTVEITEDEYDFYWDHPTTTDPELQRRWQTIDNKHNCRVDYLDTVDINKIITCMNEIDIHDRVSMLNFEELNENNIYPEGWAKDDESQQYIKLHFKNLLSFLTRAYKNKEYVIVK